jgi:hypothetical protein
VKNTSRDKPDEWLDVDEDAPLTITLNSEKIINRVLNHNKLIVQEEESGDKGEQAVRVSGQTA